MESRRMGEWESGRVGAMRMGAMGAMGAMRAMRAKSRSRRRWYDPMVVTAMARDGKYGCWQAEAQSSQGYVDGGIACSRRVGLLVAASQKLLVRHFADFPLITLERTVSNQAHNHSQSRKNDQSQPNTNRRILIIDLVVLRVGHGGRRRRCLSRRNPRNKHQRKNQRKHHNQVVCPH